MLTGANQNDYLALYAFERPTPALPVGEFVDELRAMVRAHPIDAGLATALRYGQVSRDAMRRWIKDYWQWIREDAQGSAAMIARCRRRGLFIALSQIVNRKTGLHQVTTPSYESFLRFAAAFGLERDELDAHYGCPETLQATYTRLQFQFGGFEEGFVVTALAAEGALLDVTRDERPFLCQRGLAESMKRGFGLSDDAVAYWRAYEDFRGFVCEPVWELVRDIAVDASQQALLRTTLRDWLLLYANMRRAWSEIAAGTYPVPEFVWPPPGARFQKGGVQTYDELEEEIGAFCLGLPKPGETAFGYLLSGKAPLAAARELVCDFIQMDATRNIAGFTRLPAGSRAFRAIAQAFATESGGYLTRNHMEIWADFVESAFGMNRAALLGRVPTPETLGAQYVTKWFLCHGSPVEAIAAFHLGPPTRVKERMGKAALGLGQGGIAGEGLILEHARNPLSVAFEKLGIDPDIADYFFRLHREIEPFEQDEGWEYVPTVLTDPRDYPVFRRAYIAKILAESRKDEALLRRMKAASEGRMP
jgi:pyrroloquinoline quinone (PQQ) biosynthesis protein C